MKRTRPRALSILALGGLLLAALRPAAGLAFVCVEADGHTEVELWRTRPPAPEDAGSGGPAGACDADGCGPCEDVALQETLGAVLRPAHEFSATEAITPTTAALAAVGCALASSADGVPAGPPAPFRYQRFSGTPVLFLLI